MLIVVGLLMWAAEYVGRKQKDMGHITSADAISIGIAQALAVVPGTSRSGITISAGLFRNLDRRAAARFSFLLSTPAIAAAAGKDFWDMMKHEGGLPSDMHVPFAVGILVSAIVGCITIKFFMDFLRRSTFTVVHHLPHHLWHNSNRSGQLLPLPAEDEIFRTYPAPSP